MRDLMAELNELRLHGMASAWEEAECGVHRRARNRQNTPGHHPGHVQNHNA